MNMPVDLVTHICQHLATKPEAIKVQASIQGRVRNIEIQSAPEDAGRLIGRGGRVINSIRLIAQAANEHRDRIEIHYLDENANSDASTNADTNGDFGDNASISEDADGVRDVVNAVLDTSSSREPEQLQESEVDEGLESIPSSPTPSTEA